MVSIFRVEDADSRFLPNVASLPAKLHKVIPRIEATSFSKGQTVLFCLMIPSNARIVQSR
jgi:hypothetical protein